MGEFERNYYAIKTGLMRNGDETEAQRRPDVKAMIICIMIATGNPFNKTALVRKQSIDANLSVHTA